MVVIAIIGILAAVVTIATGDARGRAQDARRISDLRQISLGLESFVNEKDKFPVSSTDSPSCNSNLIATEQINNSSCSGSKLKVTKDLTDVPQDPVWKAGDEWQFYHYQSDGAFYILQAKLSNGRYYYSSFAKTAGNGQATGYARGENDTPIGETNDPPAVPPPAPVNPGEILIIVNGNSPDSVAVGKYYAKRRGIPDEQIVRIDTTTNEVIGSYALFESEIRQPIKDYMSVHNLNNILYIVTTYGVPNRINYVHKTSPFGAITDTDCQGTNNGCDSVDSQLVNLIDNSNSQNAVSNHYFNKNKFFQKNYGDNILYLVTRLDGKSAKIAKGLIDKAIYAEKYIDLNSGKAYMSGEYPWGVSGNINSTDNQCAQIEGYGYTCTPDYYSCPDQDTAHCSLPLGDRPKSLWHSGILNYYSDVWSSWVAGAIAFEFRSYAAKSSIRQTNLSEPISVPFYLAADVTGTAGPVDEPGSTGIPLPSIFYKYFLNGHFNFAESMYMATKLNNWKAIIVGDPVYTLSSNPDIDNERPLISNVRASRNGNSVTVSWDNFTSISNASNAPEVTYGSLTSNSNEVFDETSLISLNTSKKNYLSQHSITIQNPGANIQIKAVDPAGNISTYELSTP